MKLGLGTVQFGMNYGVSNVNGKTNESEVKCILDTAYGKGIRILDTAAVYGNAEQVIGRTCQTENHFDIVSKTRVYSDIELQGCIDSLVMADVDLSLSRLGTQRLYGLLVHSADNLLHQNGSQLIESLQRCKHSGKTRKIGVSVYSPTQMTRILELFTPDIVQIPINIFDQRMLKSGMLHNLKELGVEVHARSLFLQGLLLMDKQSVDSYFERYDSQILQLQNFLHDTNTSRLDACLGFAHSLNEYISTAVVGATTTSELEEIISAWDGVKNNSFEFSQFATSEEGFVNPSLWKLSGTSP